MLPGVKNKGTLSGWLAVWLLSFNALATAEAGPGGGAGLSALPLHMKLGPMLGHVEPHEARVWVQLSEAGQVDLMVGQKPDLSDARWVSGPACRAGSGHAGVTVVPGLEPGQTYYYGVLLNRKPALSPPYPSFKTPQPDGTRERLRVAFTSCSGYSAPDPAAGWADMAVRTNIDLVLLLGDNHYANSVDRQKQRYAYDHQRQSVGFRDMTEGTPTYGIWDDHDFGPDNSDGTLPGKEQALQAFKEHWANPGYGQSDDPGVYFRLSRGAVDIFMLDVRYHRSRNKQADDGTKTMLGQAQLAWLKRELKASRAPVKIVASGSEWQSQGTDDSWSRFKSERDDLFNYLKQEGIEGVFLISGDRHYTAAYQVVDRFIEVTSGPLGGNTAKPKNTPEMFLKHGDGRFYCVLDIDTLPDEPVLTLEIYRIGTGRVERRVFSWEEIVGKKAIKRLGSP